MKLPFKKGTLLAIVEKDDGILEYFTQEVTAYAQRIEIPVKDTYYPNFYLKVYAIGSQDGNPLPVFKR